MLNAIGLENKGVDDFVTEKLPVLRRFGVPVVASIAGDDEKEFARLAARLDKIKGVAAVELNLSCPNITGIQGPGAGAKGRIIAQDEEAVGRIVKAVRKSTALTVIAKLSPNVTDIVTVARTAEAAGADAVSLVNTFIGMAVDVDSQSSVLGNVTGGLSGPAIKPMALRMVWETYKSLDIPVIGIGGIMNWRDAIEFILCGAAAVQVGTANFVDPSAPVKIVGGISGYMKKNRIGDLRELVGALRTD
jgi:dihydroorotate dehydrogenase (NAD+) catalytic subunit